jgi:hypothetical protein
LESLGRVIGIDKEANDQKRKSHKTINIFVLALLILAVIIKAATVYPKEVNEEYFQETLPYGAVANLKHTQPPGRLFNPYNWGGYLLWALPEYAVFVDGRTDLYDDTVISEWLQVVRTEDGWVDILDKYNINILLLERDSLLAQKVDDHNDWTLLYFDSISLVYTR